MACLTSTLPELTVHLRFPAEHWQRIRHTNLLERTFGETRRRTKVIGRLPGERSCLRLVWAVLDRASKGWRGLTYTPAATRLLQDLRRDLPTPPAEPITSAAYHARQEPRPSAFPPPAGRDLARRTPSWHAEQME